MISNCYDLTDHFPHIDSEKLRYYSKENDKNHEDHVPIEAAQFDLQFIRTVRNHDKHHVSDGSIDRSEFVEFIVRLGKSAYPLMSPVASTTIIISLFLTPL